MIKKKKYESDLFNKLVQATNTMYEQGISFTAMTWHINGDQFENTVTTILLRDQLFKPDRPICRMEFYGITIEQDNMLGANIIELRGSDMAITLEIE